MASPVRDVLLARSDEFRRLVQDHQKYSTQLDQLLVKPYLSDDDKLEEIRLKKLKLRTKDQMEVLEQEFRRTQPTSAA